MKHRAVIYIVVSIICVISIVVAVYYQIVMNKKNVDVGNSVTTGEVKEQTINLEAIKDEFNSLFTNSFDDQGYKTATIKKIPGLESESLVFSAYTIKQEEEGKYNVNLNIPVFNIDGEIPAKYNATTQSIFANKATEVLNNSSKYTIYNIDFTSFYNDDILSLVIRATLKEGNNPERLIVQTYNYNVKTNEEVTLNSLLEKRGIALKDVNKKIEEYVSEAKKQEVAISSALTGQMIYERDLDNAMYTTDHANYFFIGENGQIYILYPYGNSNYTSEIDIIKVEEGI